MGKKRTIMKNRICGLFILLFVLISCQSKKPDTKKTAIENPNSLSIKLVNGEWFNGNIFERKTAWVREGILSFKNQNTENNTIIDLSGKFIVPPFGEAHNHNLESEYELSKRINSYLENGVFYVKHLSSIKKRIDPLMHHYNKPGGIDVTLAHAPLTGTGGHPVALRKRFLDYGYFEGLFETIEEIESHGYFTIDDSQDLENKWSKILSFKPDFIKINLLYSEEYQKRKNDTAFFGKKGLNPELVPEIVKKAHQHDLRVSAHVETAHDFHVAVRAGVDEIAHLPEISNGKQILVEDATLAKEKGTIVVPTISLVTKRKKKANYNQLVENIKTNLKILKEQEVQIAIGSDMYNDNSTGEFQLLYSYNIFSNLELLKMWCENSASTIFPNRKIGHLKEGYEASFLALSSNPLESMKEINKSIILKVKQGEILDN